MKGEEIHCPTTDRPTCFSFFFFYQVTAVFQSQETLHLLYLSMSADLQDFIDIRQSECLNSVEVDSFKSNY